MAINALQSASSGLSALNVALDVTANNLANVNTAGFKSSRTNFQDLLYLEKRQPGVENAFNEPNPIGLYVGLGVRVSGTQVSFESGNPISGGQMDVFIQGEGFFQVRVEDSVSADNIAYTRNGQFTLNANGDFVLASDPGRRLEPPITVDADAELSSIEITSDGRVLVKTPGDAAAREIGQFELATFINPAGLTQNGGTLFVETESSGPPVTGEPGTDNRGTLLQGFYEASNVDPTRELIDLIRTQRAFEMNSNTIRVADEMLRSVAQLQR